MNRTLLCSAVLAASVAFPSRALEFTAEEVGTTKTVEFGGMLNGKTAPGLSGVLTIKLIRVEGDRFRFAYSFRNTSSAPFTRARASLWGFDIPDVNHATSTAPFRFMGTGDTAGLGHRDVCFGARTHESCREGDGGVALGRSGSGAFGFHGAKGGRVQLDNLFVRWADLEAPSLNLKKGSAVGLQTVR